MAACQQDGNHTATCQAGKCETVDSTEICTQCRAGGVPVGGFCWPPGSPQAAAAGCTQADGTALDKTAATCEKCGDGYFLFMGGCYNKDAHPGSDICTKAEGGVCTACKVDGQYIFQNTADKVTPGSECILCHDATGANENKGVANCLKCTAPTNSPGAATCTECQDGYYKDAKGACVQCQGNCATCETSAAQCTSCKGNTFLKSDKTCVTDSQCDQGTYADKKTWTCKACSEITGCTACTYNDQLQKPVCSACTAGGKTLIKTELDGTTTCVDAAGCAANAQAGTHFLTKTSDKCLLCNDVSDTGEAANKGVEGCGKCKKENSNTAPACTECLEGYIGKPVDSSPGTVTCSPCHKNCATCSEATIENKCTKCKAGFFLVDVTDGKKCVPCDSTTDGGREGCSACSNNNGFKCTECKANYRKQSNGGANDDYTCVKTCEDETACGGTAGACDATVIDANGKELHYCSYCGKDNEFPINGICTNNKESNTCTSHTCTQCAANYFLYMGGCYSTQKAPGNFMCKKSNDSGICTEAANDKYFVVPGASNTEQSILACGNPLGTLVDTKAYVGVDGCSACTAPVAPSDGGMTAAVCTSCDNSKKPNLAGSGCFPCAVSGCSHCNRDDMCEACSSGKKVSPGRKSCVDGCPSNSTDDNSVCTCSDGYSPDSSGTSCVSSGTNRSGLSTGAIAGISVAVVAVVGGLVGFLCWWFVCRGKA